jgi:hypothetical protein
MEDIYLTFSFFIAFLFVVLLFIRKKNHEYMRIPIGISAYVVLLFAIWVDLRLFLSLFLTYYFISFYSKSVVIR